MQYGKWIVAISYGLLMAACGPTVDGMDPNPSLQGMASSRSALCTVTATCAGASPISCSGSVCSAVDYQYVRCDGNTQYCNCVINGQSYPNGTVNPNNICQWCNTAVSATSWTNHNYDLTNGVPGYCKYHVCLASQCAGSWCSVHGGNCDGYCSGGVLYCGGEI